MDGMWLMWVIIFTILATTVLSNSFYHFSFGSLRNKALRKVELIENL